MLLSAARVTVLARNPFAEPAWRRRATTKCRAAPTPAPPTAAVLEKWDASAAPSTAGRNEKAGVSINSAYDSGNVEVLDVRSLDAIQLHIHSDPWCESDQQAHAMWFNYRVTGAAGWPLTMHIRNAGQCSFPVAWEGYRACASYDLEHWFRVPTTYDSASGVLTIQHTPERDACQYAYFAPFTYNRHRNFIARIQSKDGVRLHMLAETVDGHDLDCLQLGATGPAAAKKPKVWIIARQHPGESQAEWFMEGLLDRLTDPADGVARHLLRDAQVFAVPNCNPDGTWRGHLRTNAAGVNLNRAWAAPCKDDSPEVFHLLKKMEEVGVDLLVDVHGDEELPYCFIAGSEGIPGWSDRLAHLQGAFTTAFKRASPDFQTEKGYEVDAPGEANMSICSNQVAQKFDCLAVTLEMPFKDTAGLPDELQGWSPQRCRNLGASMLSAVHEVLPLLRD